MASPLTLEGFLAQQASGGEAPPSALQPAQQPQQAAPLYVNPNTPRPRGMVQPGNTDLTQLPVINNGDGSYSTVYSTSFNDEKPGSPTYGKEVLVRGILNGKKTDDIDALKREYYRTGKHLGVFDSGQNADPYAQQLHSDWEAGKIPGVQMGRPQARAQQPQAPSFNLDTFLEAQRNAPRASSTLPQPDEADRQATAAARVIAEAVTRPTPQDYSAVSRAMAANPPAVPRPELPSALQTDEQTRATAPVYTNPRTGQRSRMLPAGEGGGPLSVLDMPLTGAGHVAEGIEQMAEPGLREKAGGAHKVIGGAFEAATPLMAGAGAAAPLATAGTLAAATVSQEAVARGLKKLGIPEEYADVAGDIAGIVAGFGAHKISARAAAALKAKYEPILKARAEQARPETEYNSAGQPIYRPGTLDLDSFLQEKQHANATEQTKSGPAAQRESGPAAESIPSVGPRPGGGTHGQAASESSPGANAAPHLETSVASHSTEAQPVTSGSSPVRRVTGSANVPLTDVGRQQAEDLHRRINAPGHLVKVFTAPNDRSVETGQIVSPGAQAADWLAPWKMGAHEGKPLDTERDAINDRIVNRPDEKPGVSPHSGEQGESFSEARSRLIGGLQRQSAELGPNDRALNVTSGRALQIIDAWAKAGKPGNGSVDTNEIVREREEFSKPGQLFRLGENGLEPVARIKEPGQYFAQHGETVWNRSQQAPSAAALPAGGMAPRNPEVRLNEFHPNNSGPYPNAARLVLTSPRTISAEEVEGLFPGYNVGVEPLKPSIFTSQGQPGVQLFNVQFFDPNGRAISTPPEAGNGLGVAAGERFVDKPVTGIPGTRPQAQPAADSSSGAKRQFPQPGREATPQGPVSRPPAIPASYGREVNVAVPGETTTYPARYAIRDASDVEPSHNAFSFEANPRYEFQNDRDYRNNAQLSSLVAEHAGERFNPEFVTGESPTAEHGAPIIDARGNVLGGNSRAMTLARVYQSNPQGAEAYRASLRERAASYGLNPSDVDRFPRPVLVRELARDVDPQNAITDFNKGGPAALSPAERAVADGRRLSTETVRELAGKLEDVGEDSTLAQALRGDNGAEVVNRLVQDGILTPQEKNGLVDERGQLTGEAKDRIARMLVGRLFDSPAAYNATPPELRGKLERVAPQVLRVEDRPEWNITPMVREAVNALAEARAHGIRNIEDLARQQSLTGETKEYRPEALAIARTLRQGPLAAAQAFRRYANDESLSREGAQVSFFTPPTRAEAFTDAFERSAARSSAERGAISPELLNLGIAKFWEDDVAPRVRDAARAVIESGDDVLKILAPQIRSESAHQAGLIMRNRLAELARRYDQAEHSLRQAKRAFDRMPAADNYEFIRRIEAGERQQAPELDSIASVLRELLDGRRADVQRLGTGKLRSFYERYFPHVWAEPKRAAQVFASIFSRKPLEGGKSFLKQRTHLTFEDGLNAGLKPVSDNPVDLVLLKVREMDKYLMGHQTLDDWKKAGLAKFVDARKGNAPAGWRKIDDPVGTVYGPSIQHISEYPNEGLWSGLGKVADALGIEHERGFLKLRGAVGRANMATGKVSTLHGSAEDVLAHEVGHIIDAKAGSGKRFVLEYPDAQTVARLKQAYATLRDDSSTLDQRRDARAELKSLKGAIANRTEFARQLRALADLRSGEKSYTHKREEKMAQLAEMWVGARDLFQRTAPRVFEEWKKFLDENPKLHALRDIEGNTEVTPISQPYDVGGLVIRGNWYAPEGAARILNNYLSPGLRDRSGIFRGLLGLNNVLNQFQLGMSAFHLGFTAADATVSKAALGYQALFRSKPIEAAKQFLATPIAPFTTYLKGDRLLKEWYSPGSQGAAIGNLVDNLVAAGGRARMDQMYRTQIGERMMQALRRGNIIGAALRAPFAGVEWTSNLLMNEVVPRMKLGAFADLARFHLENLPPDATFEEARRVLSQDWDSVENRLGEMTYDNLFWDKTAKDLAMVTTRSVGWNLGTLREIGGGIGDTVVQPANALRGKPVNLNRLSYLLGLLTVHMMASALYQKLKTGKWPDELEDFFFPKNGEVDEHGRPQRVSLPTYVKDIFHYATEPLKTLEGKIAPIWTAFSEMIHNQDFYRTEIRNPDDPLVKQLTDLTKAAGEQFVPIGVRNFERESELGASPSSRAEQFVGISPAPAALNVGPGERLARDIAAANAGGEARTPEQAERRDLRQKLSRSLQAGKGVPQDVLDARRQGKLSKRDVEEAIRASRQTALQQEFSRLGVDDAFRVYAKANADERKQVRPMLLKKARAAMETEAPAQRARTMEKVRAAIAGTN
jgi:broad specificity phosphatase PhoE